MNKSKKWAKKSVSKDEIINVKFNPVTGTKIVKKDDKRDEK